MHMYMALTFLALINITVSPLALTIPAAAGDDIVVSATSIMFLATDVQDMERCITITGIPDTEIEGTETLGITIADSPMYTIDGGGVGFAEFVTIFVVDEDASKWTYSITSHEKVTNHAVCLTRSL